MNGNNKTWHKHIGKRFNEYRELVFYHGTSTICKVGRELIPPERSLRLREGFRKKNQNVVFLTISLPSAIRYAKKACEKFGGEPIVYRAIPRGKAVMNGTECICDRATVIKNSGEIIKKAG